MPSTGQVATVKTVDTWDPKGTVSAEQGTFPGRCKRPHSIDDAYMAQPKRVRHGENPGLHLWDTGQQVQGVVLSEAGGALPIPTGGEPRVTDRREGK